MILMPECPSRLNHYRILEPLAKGGMGEVYLAEDLRLQRKVAIKVLPTLRAADIEWRSRFEREARAVAALNHPGIVTIHSVEDADGLPFIVMELVEGQTLAALIAPPGLPIEPLLRIGVAVGDAVAAAHQRGIIHRDLKPANVMVTADGRVKVLDFGLAKLRAAASPDALTQMPTDLTGEGRLVGTVAYMSPEQIEGKEVDSRTDIFSLGVMLYEMATGDRPFKGDTSVSVLSAILKDTPPSVTELRPDLSDSLARAIRRALSKDPSRRFQTATDLRNELEELQRPHVGGVTTPVRARWSFAGIAIGAAVAAAVALAIVFGLSPRQTTTAAPPAVLFEGDRFMRLTATGDAESAAISRDGRYVVHTKLARNLPELWMRQTATQSDVRIIPATPVQYRGLTFSPDGNHVFFVSSPVTGGIRTLFRIPVLGGTAQRVLEDVDSRVTFSPDGKRFAFMRGDPSTSRTLLMTASVDGTNVVRLATTEEPDLFRTTAPAWSPDGKTILVAAQSMRDGPHNICFAVDATNGARSAIGGRWESATDVDWLPDGRSFVVVAAEFGGLGRQLWQVTSSTGERRRITNDLKSYTTVSVAGDGRSLSTVQAENGNNIWLISPGTTDMAQLSRGRNRSDGLLGLGWTPDGRLVFSSTASGRLELWVMNADGTAARQLTESRASSFGPTISPDGRRVVFQEYREGGMDLIRVDIDGSNRQALTSVGANFEPIFSRDGQWIFYNSLDTGRPLPFKVSIEGGQPIALSPASFRPFDVSPDGGEILGVGWDAAANRPGLAIMPSAGGEPISLGVPVTDGIWAPGGKAITFPRVVDGVTNVWIRERSGGTPRQLTQFKEGELGWFAWSPDGKRLAVSHGVGSSDVVLVLRK
jgi:Tol biopolymer transport system component